MPSSPSHTPDLLRSIHSSLHGTQATRQSEIHSSLLLDSPSDCDSSQHSNNPGDTSLSILLYGRPSINNHGYLSSYAASRQEVLSLFKDYDYCILFFVFSIGMGIFNTLIALLNQMIEKYGYTDEDAGYFGALLVIVGVIASGIAGKILLGHICIQTYILNHLYKRGDFGPDTQVSRSTLRVLFSRRRCLFTLSFYDILE
jgi:hypothetical protein